MEGASHYCAAEWSIAVDGVLLVVICSVKDRSVDVMVGSRVMGWDGAWVEGRVMGMARGLA